MDYAHARHAGNSGDVFKHLALFAVLEALREEPWPLRYVESHAGDGLFSLGATGEWSGGIQRLWPAPGAKEPSSRDLIDRYLRLVMRWSSPGAARPDKYPGSPLIAQALLRPQDRLVLHELERGAAGRLREALGREERAEVVEGDGFEALPEVLAPGEGAGTVVLVDPPYTRKTEWDTAAHAVCAARRAAPRAALIVWYPITALTPPRGLRSMLSEGGVHGTLVELLSSPQRLERDELAGSGLLLIGVPERAVAQLASALVRLGPALMTHGEWGARQIGF